MSLDWSIDKCQGYKDGQHVIEVDLDEGRTETRQNPRLNDLIWATIMIGIGEVTEKNVDEVFARLAFTEALYGPRLHRWDPEQEQAIPEPWTREMLTPWIGLRTNVFPKEAQGKWLKRQFEYFTKLETRKAA
jgi:hypothetical protein